MSVHGSCLYIYTALFNLKFKCLTFSLLIKSLNKIYIFVYISIIESVDSISRDEPDSPLTQYITNAGIYRARYTITLFKHHHRVLRLISNQINV